MLTDYIRKQIKLLELDKLKEEQLLTILDTDDKNRITAEIVEYNDGTIYYSDDYVRRQINTAYSNGQSVGAKESINKHTCVMSPCEKCGHTPLL